MTFTLNQEQTPTDAELELAARYFDDQRLTPECLAIESAAGYWLAIDFPIRCVESPGVSRAQQQSVW